MNVGTDDWEPAVAADPNSAVRLPAHHPIRAPKPCSGNCPVPHIAIEISDDNGQTWSEGAPLCACKGSGQFDPIIEVVHDTGHVYALWMNGFNVVFQRSTNHGATWSAPVPTWGNVSWNDKPVLTSSDDGRDVYVSWNGPTGGDPWIAQSHDFGATWSQRKIVDSGRYFFAFDAEVTSDGTVLFSESSFDYSGPGASAIGQVRHHVFISRNEGATWERRLLGSVDLGEPCVTEGCYDDFYAGHNSVTADDDDDLVYVFDGATEPGGPQRVFVRRSTDEGRTWSTSLAVSSAGRMATGPAAEATGDGDVRLVVRAATAVRRLEHLVPPVGRWRRDVEHGRPDLGCLLRRRIQGRRRVPRVLRRLRGNRRDAQREDDRGLGRGIQLARAGRDLVQHRILKLRFAQEVQSENSSFFGELVRARRRSASRASSAAAAAAAFSAAFWSRSICAYSAWGMYTGVG